MSHDDVNAFLMGGGVTSAKFDQPGVTIAGTIVHLEKQQQRDMDTGKPMFWDDGKPREQICVHLQTTLRDPAVEDDDGIRALYVKGNMTKAVREALRKSAARLDTGGELTVTYTGDGEQTRKGFNPPKLYTARYTPPASSVDALLGQPAAAAPVPTQAAPAAPAAAAPPAAPAASGQLSAQGFYALPEAVQEMLRASGQLPAGVA